MSATTKAAAFRLADPQGRIHRVLIDSDRMKPVMHQRTQTVYVSARFDLQKLLDRGWRFA